MVDESLVKEEMVETLDNSQSEGMDTSMQYGGVGSDPSMDGAGDEHSNRMMPNKYDQPVIPGQAQPLADAVAEALAGPSGMQGVRREHLLDGDNCILTHLSIKHFFSFM